MAEEIKTSPSTAEEFAVAHEAKLAIATTISELVGEYLDDQGLIESRELSLISIGVAGAMAELMSPLPSAYVEDLMKELVILHKEAAEKYASFAAMENTTIQ